MADNLGIRFEYEEPHGVGFADIARQWLDHGREVFCTDFVTSIERFGSPKITEEPQERDPAWEAFGMIDLENRTPQIDHSLVQYSRENWAWLQGSISESTWRTWLDFHWLHDQESRDGYSFFVKLHVQRVESRPERPQAVLDAQRRCFFDADAAQKLIAFMTEMAAKLPPKIGYSSAAAGDDFRNTNQHPPVDLDQFEDDPRILLCFDWLTYAGPQVIEALGGHDAVRESGRFHEVRALPNAGAILVATPTAREYTERIEASLGRYLKAVLPPRPYWWDTKISNPRRRWYTNHPAKPAL